jgi:hypothetical protein
MRSGISIRQILEEKKQIRIRYEPMGCQLSTDIDPKEVEKIMNQKSFAFLVLPKSGKAVVLEEDTKNIIGAPPKWKERARFRAREN